MRDQLHPTVIEISRPNNFSHSNHQNISLCCHQIIKIYQFDTFMSPNQNKSVWMITSSTKSKLGTYEKLTMRIAISHKSLQQVGLPYFQLLQWAITVQWCFTCPKSACTVDHCRPLINQLIIIPQLGVIFFLPLFSIF